MLPKVRQQTEDRVILEMTSLDQHTVLRRTREELQSKNPVIYRAMRDWAKTLTGARIMEAEICFLTIYKMLAVEAERSHPPSKLPVVSSATEEEFVRIRLRMDESDFFRESIDIVMKENSLVFKMSEQFCRKQGILQRRLLCEFLHIYRLMDYQSKMLERDTERFQHLSPDTRPEIRNDASPTLNAMSTREFI